LSLKAIILEQLQ